MDLKWIIPGRLCELRPKHSDHLKPFSQSFTVSSSGFKCYTTNPTVSCQEYIVKHVHSWLKAGKKETNKTSALYNEEMLNSYRG